MRHDCWNIWSDRGFLINPDPISQLNENISANFPLPASDIAHIEAIADELPDLMVNGRVRDVLGTLPLYEMTGLEAQLDTLDFRVIERLQQIYACFASAYVYAMGAEPSSIIPRGIAVPLVQLSRMVERPPILSYCGYTLSNWRRLYPDAPITVDTLTLNQPLLGNKDESWFVLIHVNIEARAAGALTSINEAAEAVRRDDAAGVENGLRGVIDSVYGMMATFKRMPEGCDSDVYYHKVRPYLFGFNDVIYEGAYDDQPQTVRGQTGAQSSIVPALVAALGLRHERTGLTHHLDALQDHMPRPHREFIARMKRSGIRPFVVESGNAALAEAYNDCLRTVMEFRRLHFDFVNEYIMSKVKSPVGTGGTMFTDWLTQLITETETHLVR